MREQSLVTTKRKIPQLECESLVVVVGVVVASTKNMSKLVRLKGCSRQINIISEAFATQIVVVVSICSRKRKQPNE